MFTGLKSLRLLDLAHNKVAKVDAGALDALVNLDEPDLSNNQIATFEDGSFQKMAALQTFASMTIASPSSPPRWSWAWALPWRAST